MTNTDSRKLFEDVDRALRMLGCDIGCAECHGVLCGMLCNPERFEANSWLRHVSGHGDLIVFGGQDSGHVMWDLLRYTQAGIAEEDFSFRPLLASDDETMSARIESLGAWCRGFLSGFGLAGITDLSVLSDDARGFLKDLAHITRADEQSDESEQSEQAMVDVVEYVRIGVLMLREETRFVAHRQNAQPTLH